MNLSGRYHKYYLLLVFIGLFFNAAAYNTVNYNAKNGIASNGVRKIFIDHIHRVWLGTDNGVSCMTGNGIKNYLYSNGLDYSKIWEIEQCPDSSLWFGSFGNGLYEYRNSKFYNYQLPRSRANNSIRKLKSFGKYLFIGTEAGLNVFDYQKREFIPFKNLSEKDSFQILDFFEYKGKLYFQSFFYGTFEINPDQKTFRNIRFNQFENKWNYSAYQHNGTLFLSRTRFNESDHHNLLFWKADRYLSGAKPDSIAINTVIWEFANTSDKDMFAACWGVRDNSGGLYKLHGKKMQRMNEAMGINSNQLLDVEYDKLLNKLYVASIDKGLYVIDLNEIVVKLPFEEKSDILDMKMSAGRMFVLKNDTLQLYRERRLIKSVTMTDVTKFMDQFKPVRTCNYIDINAEKRFRDLSISADYLVINSNFAEVRLDYDLNILDYIFSGSDGRVCFLSKNDVLVFRDYGNSEFFGDFGKGKHFVFKHWIKGKTNPRDVSGHCRLNDTTYLLASKNQRMYLYIQNDTLYKRFEKLGNVHLPTHNDRLGENSFVSVDQSNVLYKGVYAKDSLLMTKLIDLRQFGVIESYFVRAGNGLIVVATNKGGFVLDRNNLYLIDRTYGLPNDLIVRTATVLNDKIYAATTAGVYLIDVKKLHNLKLNWKLSALTVSADSLSQNFSQAGKINLYQKPTEIVVRWEINNHPYPENLQYSYRIGNDNSWSDVATPGSIKISSPQYGITDLYLRIMDDTTGNKTIVHLLSFDIPKPFYLQIWFYIVLAILFSGIGFYFTYRIRVRKLKEKTVKAQMETSELQLRIDLLQFLLKPHFIFNALSSVQNLMLKKEIDKSIEYTSYFAKFLRGIMQNSGEQLIPLKDEIENTLRYIELEKLRFNENVEVKFSIEDQIDTLQTLIIPFLFQPLIENMFKHAFTKEIANPRIDLSIALTEDSIIYSISDNGKGLNGQTYHDVISKSTSKGLKITLAQLTKYYPDKHTLTVSDNATGGVSWVITVKR